MIVALCSTQGDRSSVTDLSTATVSSQVHSARCAYRLIDDCSGGTNHPLRSRMIPFGTAAHRRRRLGAHRCSLRVSATNSLSTGLRKFAAGSTFDSWTSISEDRLSAGSLTLERHEP